VWLTRDCARAFFEAERSHDRIVELFGHAEVANADIEMIQPKNVELQFHPWNVAHAWQGTASRVAADSI